jgi:transposase
MSKVIGIDISKQKFDVCFLEGQNKSSDVFTNDLAGFKKLAKYISSSDHVVMEATGPYFLKLATYMVDNGYRVSVVNPLVIKHYSRMRMSRAKTDKKDAFLIACYGQGENPPLWNKQEEYIMQINQGLTLLQGFEKQLTMNKNQMEALSVLPYRDKLALKALRSIVSCLEKQVLNIEQHLQEVVMTHYQDSYKALQTIPGIGPKASLLLIAVTGNFEKFTNSRQLISYLGLSPRIYESGTSVKSKAHICKMGMSKARRTLYMCSWTAKFYNPQCKELYQRLLEKGKPERVIKIAIANKLVRMAFAVGKNLSNYDKNYRANVCF